MYILIFSYGLAVTGRYFVGYTYNMELQPKKIQTLIGTTTMGFEVAYMFIVSFYFIFSSRHWSYLMYPSFIMGMSATFCVFLFLPESPRFYLGLKRFEDARRIFSIIAKTNRIDPLPELKFEGEG